MTLKNNLLISFRHLKADKTNTFISISGLVLGLGIVAVVLVFVLNELSYNRSFAHKDQIYRVLNYREQDNHTWTNTPFVLGETAKNEFAEVEDFVHQYNIGDLELKKGDEFIHESEVMCTESNFFSVFGVKVLQGSLSDFDHTRGTVLLSKSLAEKYFGSENPVGKQLTVRYSGKEFPMEVAAVFSDIPQTSSIKASLIAGIDFGMQYMANIMLTTDKSTLNEKQFREAWVGGFFTNYLLLKKGVDAKDFTAKLKELGNENSEARDKLNLSLQPLSDMYFGSDKIIDNTKSEKGNLSMLYVLAFIGLLILIIATINYLNLASAKAISQVKTYAVRKVCGADKGSVAGQMIFESVIISLIALPLAVIAAWYALPLFSEMLGKSYSVEMGNRLWLSLSVLAMLTVSTAAMSGFLIAVRSSRFSFVNVLKGNKINGNNKNYGRKAMVVFQLSVFIALISIMFLVQKQVHYAFKKDLGFVKEGLIRVPLGDHDLELFKQEVSKNPNVISVSGTMWMPPSNNKMFVSIPKVSNHDEMVKVNGLFVDNSFAKTMGLKMLMGSDFDKEKNNRGVLVNELAVKALGLTDILGEQTAFGKVVGVVPDFNMYSLHEAVTPMVIGLNPGMCRDIAVRVNTKDIPATIDFMKKIWAETGGTTPFNFQFTDDILNRLYASDIRFSKTIGLLAVIAIVIASLGLFGLSLLMSKQRIKEIGVRKVNGAKISEIMRLLNGDFIKWIIVAFIVATPVAYLAMHKWLESFAYQTAVSWWIFALAGLLALGIALLTVSWQSWRAATRNPVEALRYE